MVIYLIVNRQKPIDRYIVDFYCKELKLVIEIDGDSHNTDEAILNDVERQKVLEKFGLHFLRYDDLQVKQELHWVLLSISSFAADTTKIIPPPDKSGYSLYKGE